MSEYFPKPKSLGENVKVESDFSNYATKTDLRKQTDVDLSKFAKNIDLANFKSDVDKLDIGKMKNVPSNLSNLKCKVGKLDVDKLLSVLVDLNQLSDLVKSDVFEKGVYNTKIKDIEDKIVDVTNLPTKTTTNAKINEVKNEIPSITNLAATIGLTAFENNILHHSK